LSAAGFISAVAGTAFGLAQQFGYRLAYPLAAAVDRGPGTAVGDPADTPRHARTRRRPCVSALGVVTV